MENGIWLVRAGKGSAQLDNFIDNNVVAVGWQQIGDLSQTKNKQQILQMLQNAYPDWKPGKYANSAGQLYRFAHEIKPGHRVLTYDPKRRLYIVLTVTGNYCYQPGLIDGFAHHLPVKQVGEVSRDLLSTSAKNSLGAIQTLFRIPEHVATEIDAILSGKQKDENNSVISDDDDEQLLEDIEEKSIEFIKDKVSRLDWEEMQELVAGILRAMGYKTRISPSGPDRGKDIIASPDGFGFESPRIVVEVKHRNDAMGAQAIRSFLGGRHPDDKGLYVSTGGFTKDAYYEAERANIPVTLMTLDELVTALVEHYEALDMDTKQMIPLKRVYWPI
jgi:restriction system protein